MSRVELDAMLYARGLQPAGYVPTLLDVAAVAARLFDDLPINLIMKAPR